MKHILYIFILGVLISSCKKEDELENSPTSESISYEALSLDSGNNYFPRECFYSPYTYITLQVSDLTNDTTNKTYLWSPGGQTNSTITVNKAGKYSVRIISVSSPIINTSFYSIELIEGRKQLFIPNAFTPGNLDGINDTWSPKGEGVEKYSLKIYNKENELLFKTNNFRDEWDGSRFNTSEIGPNNSTYRYVIKVKFFNSDDVEVYNGYLRLLR